MGFMGRSLFLFILLYGMLFLFADFALLHGEAPLWLAASTIVALIIVQYLVSPWMIRLFFSINWDENAIPPAARDFVDRLCAEQNLPRLRVGIIESATPNAFAFGRLQRDARIVITRGLVELLTEEETCAVLAHEVGHVAHYDFAVMTAASIAPLLLWQIYAWTNRINNLRLVSYAAYLAYWIGQFLVLMLNRTREFGADHFSARATHTPNALCTALIKISYGMVKQGSQLKRLAEQGDKHEKKAARRSLQFGRALSLMGIMSASNNTNALALGMSSAEQTERVMRWDLVNPWARVYELNSTHPLTAQRIAALNREATRQGLAPSYPLPTDTRPRWGAFPLEFLIWGAPLLCGFLLVSSGWIGKDLVRMGVMLPTHLGPWLMILAGASWAVRIGFRYRGSFRPQKVGLLLEDLDVSEMRPRAITLTGEIIGNGLPGAFWSPDLILRDETGMIFLLCRLSTPFGRLFFALRNADRFIGEQVKVEGWYRRGLRPYVEMRRIEARVPRPSRAQGPISLFGNKGAETETEYETIVARSYSRWIQLAVSAACTALGVLLLLGTL